MNRQLKPILNKEVKWQTLEQIPHPMQRSSEMKAILSAGVTSIHSFPEKKTIKLQQGLVTGILPDAETA